MVLCCFKKVKGWSLLLLLFTMNIIRNQMNCVTDSARVQDKLQCIVGNLSPATIKFGEAQSPELSDYADGVDVLKFLSELP